MIDLKRRQQRLDRISFLVFPATSLCVGLAYWAICMGLSTDLREDYV